MKFTKMEGLGNDYIYINGFEELVEDKETLAVKLSDRHFGIGGDGVIFINPSNIADFEMEMYNADGSRSEMCGNGIRCVAKYVYDRKMTDKKELTIESFGKIKFIELSVESGQVEMVRVNMGAPELEASLIPVESNQLRVIDETIQVGDTEYKMTCVSMGNPHAVVFMEDVENLALEKIGPLFEHHSRFPKRTNTEFVKVIDRNTVEMRVWERGTGETLACGTGSCATAVASILNGLTDNKVTVKLLGGDLFIEWDREINRIFMTGPAKTVFEGDIDLKNFF
jgi:diaminopimelate epimerase